MRCQTIKIINGRIISLSDIMQPGHPRRKVSGFKKNGIKVIVEDGVAKLPDRSSFAGSVATADRLVRTMISEAGSSLSEAIRMMTTIIKGKIIYNRSGVNP